MKLKKLILIFFTIVFLPTVLFSKQPGDFTIFGVVTDSISNLPMADVFVEVINEADTTEKAVAITDSSGNYNINLIVSDIHKSIDELPAEFSLNQNYPNPFNPTTIIGFQLPKISDVRLIIYNILGQKIKTVVKQKLTAGIYSAIWDGTNDTGAGVSAGLYFYQLRTQAYKKTKKMVLLDGSSGGLANISSGVQNGNVTRHLAKSKNMQVTIRATSLLIHTFEQKHVSVTSQNFRFDIATNLFFRNIDPKLIIISEPGVNGEVYISGLPAAVIDTTAGLKEVSSLNKRTLEVDTTGVYYHGGFPLMIMDGIVGDSFAFNLYRDGQIIGAQLESTVPDTMHPIIIDSKPTDGDKDIPVDGIITVRFSEPFDSTTVDSSSFTLTDSLGVSVPGVIGFNSNYTFAYLDPAYPLKPLARYTITVTTNVADLQGLHLDSTYTATFTTQIFSAQTPGTLKWAFQTGGSIKSSPAIASDGTIYVGSDDNKLYALNPDGTKKWEFLSGGANYFDYSSPAIGSDGTIYVGSGFDKKLYALNPDGTKKWEFITGSAVHSSPAIGSDGTVYVGSWDKNLYAINPDGTKKWEFHTSNAINSSPVIGPDGTIYVGSDDNKLYAINPDGTKKWDYLTRGDIDNSIAISTDGILYFDCRNAPELYAIYPDGTKKWEFQTGNGYIGSSPTIGPDGTIYIGTVHYEYKLYAINPDGTKKWEFQAQWRIASSPAIGSDSTIYVGSEEGILYAINPDGTKKWEYLTGDVISSSPAIAPDGTIYVGSDDGKLYALVGESYGLAASPWPKFSKNNKNTADSYNPDCPQARVAENPIFINTGIVTLDGSPSYDPDGESLDYLWRIVRKPTESTLVLSDSTSSVINVNIPIENRGGYHFSLTVTDHDDGYSATRVFVSTGRIWEFQTGDEVYSSPAIGFDGTVYVGSLDDNLYALNPDGTKKWEFLTGGDIYSSPAIGADNTIYVGSFDNKLYAINPDGSPKWEFQTGDEIYSSPAIGSDGTIYVGSLDSNLYAINPDGTKKWEYLTGGPVSSSPVIGFGGTIYTSTDSLIAINPNGTKKWHSVLVAYHYRQPGNTPAMAIGFDGTIYTGYYRYGSDPFGHGVLLATYPDNTIKWGIFQLLKSSPPAVDSDGTIYVGSLNAINPDSTFKWTFGENNRGSSFPSPAIGSEGTVYVGSSDNKLYAVNTDGTKKWEFESTDPIFSSPAIGSDGTLYVGSHNGRIYAVYGESSGLANSSWPRFRHDNQNTGNASHSMSVIKHNDTVK